MSTAMSDVPGAEIVLPEVKMNLCRGGDAATARITRTEVCTARKAASFVRHIEFDVSGTPLAGVCLPGQSVGVIPPGVDEKGRPMQVRLYSLASPTAGEDGSGNVLSTTVKRTIDEHWDTHKLFLGVASNYLCNLTEGDEILVTGPAGKRFLLPADKGGYDYVFFATGTGIAPFRGMLIDLFKDHPDARAALVMGSPYATDLLYHEFFLELGRRHANFCYLPALSRERQADGHDPMYVQGRLKTNADGLMSMLHGERTLVYVCGIAGMELGIFREMGATMPRDVLEQYLRVEPDAMSDIAGWSRKMLYRQIKPTKRVFLEVYA